MSSDSCVLARTDANTTPGQPGTVRAVGEDQVISTLMDAGRLNSGSAAVGVVVVKMKGASGAHDATLPLGIRDTAKHKHQHYHDDDFHTEPFLSPEIVSKSPTR